MPRGGIRSTSFKPGVSGNPGGRPKTPQTIEVRRIILGVREAARELTLDALDTLATIMKDPKAPAAARISAALALLDRGHGKPYQAVDVKTGLIWDCSATRSFTPSTRSFLARPCPPQIQADITSQHVEARTACKSAPATSPS
jgi:hypothetical protein